MNNDELIAAGHELAKCLDNEPLIDIAKMIVRLADKLDVTTAALREKTKQCEQLVAENAALNNRMQKLIQIINNADNSYCMCGEAMETHAHGGCGHPTGMFDYHYNAWLEADTETPATDVFLREVRAQTWTEGSEPKEFGRYWVRYETDVGPQYCSAQWMEYNFCASSNTNVHKIWLADHSRSVNSLKGVTHYTKLPDALESAQLRQGGAA